jgi:hypothetical protein
MPVPLLVTVTVAAGMAAPVASVTRPVIAPVDWLRAMPQENINSDDAHRTNLLEVMLTPQEQRGSRILRTRMSLLLDKTVVKDYFGF